MLVLVRRNHRLLSWKSGIAEELIEMPRRLTSGWTPKPFSLALEQNFIFGRRGYTWTPLNEEKQQKSKNIHINGNGKTT